jgi:hypothetical protein
MIVHISPVFNFASSPEKARQKSGHYEVKVFVIERLSIYYQAGIFVFC